MRRGLLWGSFPLKSALKLKTVSLTPRGSPPCQFLRRIMKFPTHLSLPERPPAHPDVTPQTSLPEPHLKAPPCRACTVLSRHRLQGMCGASIQGLSSGKMGVVQPPAGCARPRKQLSRAGGSGMRAKDLAQALDLGSGDWPGVGAEPSQRSAAMTVGCSLRGSPILQEGCWVLTTLSHSPPQPPRPCASLY